VSFANRDLMVCNAPILQFDFDSRAVVLERSAKRDSMVCNAPSLHLILFYVLWMLENSV
jgi:hypothetical protein